TVVLGRMPLPLESLAAWPVLFSLLIVLQGPALAFTEVVISLLDRPGAAPLLGRVALAASAALTLLLVVVAATPLARLWFSGVAGLRGPLVELAVSGLWLGLLVPGLRLLTSWYQGVIIHAQRTRAVLESVLVFLGAGAVVLGAGAAWGAVTGLYVGVVGLTVAMLAQAAWLGYRASGLLRRRAAAAAVGRAAPGAGRSRSAAPPASGRPEAPRRDTPPEPALPDHRPAAGGHDRPRRAVPHAEPPEAGARGRQLRALLRPEPGLLAHAGEPPHRPAAARPRHHRRHARGAPHAGRPGAGRGALDLAAEGRRLQGRLLREVARRALGRARALRRGRVRGRPAAQGPGLAPGP